MQVRNKNLTAYLVRDMAKFLLPRLYLTTGGGGIFCKRAVYFSCAD